MADGNCNDIAIEIEAMLDKAEAPMTKECCIYEVPREIRKLNEDAYTPKVVSIGPFHHGSPSLTNMESQKQIYLKRFTKLRTKINLDSLISRVEELEPMIRCCYSKKIKFNKKEFVKMILVDAGFILELFCLFHYRDWSRDDALPYKWLMNDIIRDLYLLENQLPFFVLDELYTLAFADSPRDNLPTFLHLAFDAFKARNKQNLVPESVTIFHFTDLLRTFYLQPSDRRPPREEEMPTHLYTVTELREAGVKFKVNKTSQCLLDLKFSGCVLEIPHLRVGDNTEMWFRNMMALEHCHYPNKQYINDYVVVLDYLVNTEADVEVLVRNGILQNMLGDNNDVAKLVNGLGKNIIISNLNSNYHDICRDLNAFYENPWHTRKATLRRDYCKTPWQTAASIAAIFILIFTFIQSVCTIFQVVK